ncbi:GNAT family N-acetyltransferase [Ferdinandcohnia sp. Marseille-Q9671]
MFVYQIDEDLALKLVETNDAERIFNLTEGSRPYLREWLPWLDTTTKIEDTKAYIESCKKSYVDQKGLYTAIVYKNEIVGVASYNSIDWSNKIAHIGYWLGQQYQGNGIMTKVAKVLTEYAFETMKLNRVEIRAAVENDKSRAIPERLGFVNEGKIRQSEWLYDHYVDHVVYGMLAEDWENTK